MRYDNNDIFTSSGNLTTNMLGEEWDSWPKGELLSDYQVSTAGRVRRAIGKGWQIVNPRYMSNSTVTVKLNVDGKQKTLSLKKLVAEVWVENKFGVNDILIINKKWDDLRSCNLAWYDYKQSRLEKTAILERLRSKIKFLDLEALHKLYEVAEHL